MKLSRKAAVIMLTAALTLATFRSEWSYRHRDG